VNDAPPLFFYTKPGCGLCREALEMLESLLAARRSLALPVPTIVERDITTDRAWERAFFEKIPVVELGDRRLELVTSPARLRRLLADVLDVDGGIPPVEASPLGG
jgi:hypothetical protein